MRVQYPANVTDFETRFWRYSIKDLARIGSPALLGGVALGIPGAVLGAAAGIGLAEITPRGKNLDTIVANYVSSHLQELQLDVAGETRHRVVVLDDDTVLGFVKVDSIDLNMSSKTEWSVNIGAVSDLLKSVDFPVDIHSRKQTVNLSQYQCRKDRAIATDHFVTVKDIPEPDPVFPWKSTDSSTRDELVDEVVKRCRKVRDTLNTGDLSAEILTGDDLQQIVERFSYPELSFDNRRYRVGSGEKDYRRMLYISEFPETVESGLLSQVLNMDAPGFVDVVQSIDPVSEKQRKKLGRLVGRMRAEAAVTPEHVRRSEISRKLRDAEDLIDVEGGGERLVNHATYIVARGDSWSETGETIDEVKRLLRRNGVEFEEPWLKTPQTVKTDSPVRRDALNQQMILPSWSTASSFAFSTHDKIEDGGVVFGIDTRNGMPVILDRFSWEAGDIVRLGKKGSGKSYSAKLTLLRALHQYDDLQVYLLDPKKEYGVIGDAAGGSRIVLNDVNLDNLDVSSDVVRYTVKDRSQDNTELLTEAMQHIYQQVSQDTSKKIVLVDETWHLLNDSRGVDVLGKLVREGRDINACLELITQNTTDYLRSQEGEDILKQMNCHIFFKHNEVANSVVDVFNLSRQEALELKKLGTGSNLPYSQAIIRGPVNTKLRVQSMHGEHALINQGGT